MVYFYLYILKIKYKPLTKIIYLHAIILCFLYFEGCIVEEFTGIKIS
jgi:hypothetical protein